MFENNIDLKMELKKILRTTYSKFSLQHVKGHQDKHTPFDELTIPAKLNCLMDKYAEGVYSDKSCGEHSDIVPFYKAQTCSLSLPFGRPTTNIVEQLISFHNGHESESQLARYWNIPLPWL